ncbi:S8 family peptidase [Caulobacter sp. 17J65-9]|uniref:S8 family serine peptidase n=1 Tax=Caulobacter sp. 17J65-9 TaxID=2709382 RepID=UPI0013CA68A3|nr:S8 family serine peptidase [Caulobacter sp. 17J65-9]
MGAIHADAAYARGGSGAGVTVGVIDTGIELNQQDLKNNISGLSTDIISSRNQPQGVDDHGTDVSSIIAAEFNGFGTVGVAYGSTILSVRADSPGSCPDDCSFAGPDLARGLDYAVLHGARVVNLSIGGDGPLGPTFELALQRATAAGVVVVISAGNSSGSSPEWPARYATDARFGGLVVAVGSVSIGGGLSSFSNRAGVSAQSYIVAPGEDVITNCDNDGCWRVSGTSFAAPHVAGAVALLLQLFPNLTGREALDIVLQTALDVGDDGTDVVFGRGMLDIARALQPVGTTTTLLASGERLTVAKSPEAVLGAAFGDALRRTDGLWTVGYDAYRREFRVDLSGAYGTAGRQSPVTLAEARLDSRSAAARFNFSGAHLSLTADDTNPHAMGDPFAWADRESTASMNAELELGRFKIQSWSGRPDLYSPFREQARDTFQALAQPNQAARVGYTTGRWSLSAEQGSGMRRSYSFAQWREGTDYVRGDARFQGDRVSASLGFGAMNEPLGPLGSFLPGGLGYELPAQTRFASIDGSARFGSLTANWRAGAGATELAGSFLSAERLVSSYWGLGLGAPCAANCRMTFELSQPLRIEGGTLEAMLADMPKTYGAAPEFSSRRIDATPSGRELDLRLGAERSLSELGVLQLQAVASLQPGHVRDAEPAYGVVAYWRARF